MLNLENHATGELYPTMSNGERVTASKAGANLHWVGPAVVAGGDDLTAGQHASGHVEIYAPNPQNPGSSVGHFSTSLSPNQLMEPFDTGPKHDVGLARDLLTDIGWGAFVSLCGNGSLDPGEACDDGNTAGGDCCTADCLAALCEPDEEMPGASALVKPASLFKFVAKGSFDLPELAASDPTSAGADLSIFDTGGSGGSAVFTLPAEGWFGLGSPAGSNGYKYLGSGTSGDACSLVLVKPTVVKAVCRGSDVTVTPPLGGDLGIVLRLGTASKRYCASYGGSVVSNQDGLFKAKNAPAAACATAP
jgi:cysteine-rich repeat protein